MIEIKDVITWGISLLALVASVISWFSLRRTEKIRAVQD
jgi:hypothetical protein